MTLRRAGWMAIVLGATGSVGLTMYVGHSGFILMAMFFLWVLSPFAALGCIDLVSRGWAVRLQAKTRSLAIVLAPISLAVYGRIAFGPRHAQPAFAFLVVPLASWILLAAAAVVTGSEAGS
jgi:hypothetical protein